ncbi:transcriptional adapter 2-alpha [Anaeramoeba flamelloides]|uniref:Transcriptional adapter 2-alpha n=1 Tax=Anaeramoeba flamelloides TaxID=1746091 RepID=A0AAV7YCQ1_9EUKA|nr:transcriptional adapter 2-alpha [Anaeramoeba flamelloides]
MSVRKPVLPTFYCISCKKDIIEEIMIICVECRDTLLCSSCFSKGVEFGRHKSNHRYQIFTAPNQPIYSVGWTIEDETRLVESLYKNGFGNWEEVSKAIGKMDRYECEEHYKKIYFESTKFSYPEPLEGTAGKEKDQALGSKEQSATSQKRNKKPVRKKKGPQLSYPKPNPDNQNYPRGKTIFSEHAGWMPKREELEFEWDQDAEKVTNTFGFTDSAVGWDLKSKVLEGVHQRILQREEKKDFVIKMGLLYPKSVIEGDNHEKQCRKKRQFLSKFRIFARSLKNREQFDQIINSIFEEFKLKSEINRLLEWRQLGFTSFSEGERYQNQKKVVFTKARRGRRKIKSRSKTLPTSYSSSSSNQNKKNNSQLNNLENLSTNKLKSPLSQNSSPNINDKLLLDSQEFLSEGEKKLCKQIGMEKFQYLFIKNHILCGVTLEKIPNLQNKQMEILQKFFTQNGWL